MNTTLQLTTRYGAGALAVWLPASLILGLIQGYSLLALFIGGFMACVSAAMFLEVAYTWSYTRLRFEVTPELSRQAFLVGAGAAAAVLLLGAFLNIGWSLLLPRLTILPMLIATVVFWYGLTLYCVGWTFDRCQRHLDGTESLSKP